MGDDAGTGREMNREIPKTLTVVCIIHDQKITCMNKIISTYHLHCLIY